MKRRGKEQEQMRVRNEYRECRLCPRSCGVNRIEAEVGGAKGFCGETSQLRVGYVGPHFGEEPPLTGQNGSGTIFFSGCTLQCTYCQNHQISRGGMGEPVHFEQLLQRVQTMVRRHRVHNLNFVTPDHFLPHVTALVQSLKADKIVLPVVFNLSGYQSLSWLKAAESSVDIYLPDFKYADSRLAGRLSTCRDYPEIALSAISEMVRQKGFINVFENNTGIAEKGVLVRHLILPGYVQNSINALSTLFLEFGKELPLSIMSQYYPTVPQRDPLLNQPLEEQAFEAVYDHAMALGFQNVFGQFPEKNPKGDTEASPLLPDFQKAEPFRAGPFRARAKITSHFPISASGHLRPPLNREVLEIVHYSCGFTQSRQPNLSVNSANLFLREPLVDTKGRFSYPLLGLTGGC